jgi:hypothetical protein
MALTLPHFLPHAPSHVIAFYRYWSFTIVSHYQKHYNHPSLLSIKHGGPHIREKAEAEAEGEANAEAETEFCKGGQ